jgi:hypothetical protein
VGEAGIEGEFRGVSRVDSRDEGLDESVEGFAAESAAGEGGQGFIGGVIAAGEEEIAEGAELASSGEDGACEEGEEPGGREELKAVRHGEEATGPQDEGASVAWIRGKEFGIETEFSAEIESFRLAGDEGIGATFEQVAVFLDGPDGTTGAVTRIEHAEADGTTGGESEGGEAVRSGESRDAGTNDHDAFEIRHEGRRRLKMMAEESFAILAR